MSKADYQLSHTNSLSETRATTKTDSMVWRTLILPFLRSNAAGIAISVALVALQVGYAEYCRRRDRQQEEEGQAYSSNRPPPRPSDECYICHEDLHSPLEILPCAHIYHRNCIVEWFEFGKVCPKCRRPLSNEEVSRVRVR